MGKKEFVIPDDLAEQTGTSGSIVLRSFTLGNVTKINEIKRDINKLKSSGEPCDEDDLLLLAIERILTAVIVKLPEGVDTVLDLDWDIIEWLLPIVEDYSLPLVRKISSEPDTQSDSDPRISASEKE